jgi:histidine triad (HIT) family protein
MRVTDCLFCRIVEGVIPSTVVRDDERTLTFRDVDAKAPTHVLVIPKDHYSNAAEIISDDPALFAEMVAAGTAVAEELGIAESGYRAVFNTGPDAGQSVDHAHLHILGGRHLTWPPG